MPMAEWPRLGSNPPTNLICPPSLHSTHHHQRYLKRKRDESNQEEKFHQEDANDYHQQLSSSNIPGNSYFRLVVDRSKEGGGAKNRDSTKRGHLVLAVTQDNQVKQWELLDPQASRESIREGGQAVGYGPGINEPLEIWNQEQRSHRKETGVTILTTDGATTTTHTANAKQRRSRDEKKVANQATNTTRLAKKAKREAASDAAAELAQSQDRHETMKCGRCDVVFMADGWFKKHLQSCHSKRKEEFQKKRQRRQVSLILQDIDMLRVKEHNARKTNLWSVVVTLSPAKGFPSEAIGVKLEENDDAFVVSDVTPGSVAHRAQVQVGFVLLAVDGLEPADVNASSGNVTHDSKKMAHFVRPAPEIPYPDAMRPLQHSLPYHP